MFCVARSRPAHRRLVRTGEIADRQDRRGGHVDVELLTREPPVGQRVGQRAVNRAGDREVPCTVHHHAGRGGGAHDDRGPPRRSQTNDVPGRARPLEMEPLPLPAMKMNVALLPPPAVSIVATVNVPMGDVAAVISSGEDVLLPRHGGSIGEREYAFVPSGR